MNRRDLLSATALIPITMALAACPNTTSTQIAQYATAAENAAADVLSVVTSATSAIPAPTAAQILQYLADVKAASTAIIANAPATGASWQQQLYDAIKAVLPIAAPFLSVVPGVGLGLAALQAIMPVVASWLGLVGAPATVAVPGIPAMTPAQALKLYAS